MAMTGLKALGGALAALTLGGAAMGQSGPAIDFSGVQEDLAGEPTRVLVMGVTHLDQVPDAVYGLIDLSLVLERLEAYGPDMVAIEAVGGPTCDLLRRWKGVYGEGPVRYCRDPKPALDALGMSQPEAAAAVADTLAEWPDDPTAADRRRLAALFYGAGEPWSAAVQWARLGDDERTAQDGVSEALLGQLDAMLESRNENNAIGVTLAERLGLESLTAMDDHSADLVLTRAPEGMWSAVNAVWAQDVPGEAQRNAREITFVGTPQRVLDGVLYMNSPEYQQGVIDADFGLAAATSENDLLARHYVAWWQTRGLRMAANVVEAAGNDPGAKVLVIVGASHKAYFDAYLDQMQDVEVVDIEAVLKPETQ